MTIRRITDLTAPPVVGRTYWVPTVRGKMTGYGTRNWPVMGSLHDDRRFFNFRWRHYHVDRRFLSPHQFGLRDLKRMAGSPLYSWPRDDPKIILGPMIWRRRVCRRADHPWPFEERPPVPAMQTALANTQCRRDAAGWVCPHRGFSLGSVPAVDGVLMCPLHGLRIVAATGRVEGG